ncbi:GMP synthase-Glutamine amidotransferase [Streptomyces sp. TverLS-915]|uniref:type 1 glutamine amidotransferase n=1 Tax=Streptomyces sp. TverLS-915 TaxID=1839763 RepID=UPI00081F6299|nr:type 1 glutamine amidotransferase [Streptomyces sp. TverLS-915]SCD76937.1 GMP synthase-Glutamine amidotransferase [Streptomyces sp. TverLS-915]
MATETRQDNGDGEAREPRLLVVRNHEGDGAGNWEQWLAEGGVRLDAVRAWEGEPLPERLTHDGLLVLGGAYLPADDARAPWLPGTRALARQALGTGVPYFGICLGGQLLAHVAGGEVRGEHGTPEFGSVRLTLRPEAADDPLFHGLPAHPPAIENHVDAVTALPAGAHWLLSSADCPYQGFRVGAAAWGVQFHPEARAARIPAWNAGRLARHGAPDPASLHAHALREAPEAEAAWRTVAHRFAALVAERRGAAVA